MSIILNGALGKRPQHYFSKLMMDSEMRKKEMTAPVRPIAIG
jgi:hypothetical protein